MEQLAKVSVAVYIIIINIIGFYIMGLDKKRAIHNGWRIKEKTLFLIAAAGGSVGSLIGMKKFRHKTKHASFVFGIPGILIVQCIILGTILYLQK